MIPGCSKSPEFFRSFHATRKPTFYDPWSVDRADGLRLLETQPICIPVKPPEVADRLPTHSLFGLRRNEVPHPC
jgi:hypothetical protein